MYPVHRWPLVVSRIHPRRAHGPVLGILREPLIKRPAEVLPGAIGHLEVFVGKPTHVTDVECARICVRRIVRASAGLEREAAGIAQSFGPDPRTRRTRIAWLIVRIARQAIARGRIKPEHFPAQRIQHLAAKSTHVFRRGDDAIGQRLGAVGSAGNAAIIHRVETRSVPATHHQTAIRSENQRADAVGSMHDGKAGGFRLPQQHQPRRGVHRAKVIAAASREAREPPNGRLRTDAGSGTILGRAVVEQVVPVHDVERIDIAVLLEIRVQRKPQQAVVRVVRRFFANIQHRRRQFHAIFDDEDPAITVPDIGALLVPRTVHPESDTHRTIPAGADSGLDKPGWKRSRPHRLRQQWQRQQGGNQTEQGANMELIDGHRWCDMN